MAPFAAPLDAERTLSFFKFQARRHGLKECEGQLAGLPIPEMQTFKQLVLQQGDGLSPDMFAAWLASTALGEWELGVCKECPGKLDDTCSLLTLVVAPYFLELAEVRRRSSPL